MRVGLYHEHEASTDAGVLRYQVNEITPVGEKQLAEGAPLFLSVSRERERGREGD